MTQSAHDLNEAARDARRRGCNSEALNLYHTLAELQRAGGASLGEAHALRHIADIQLDSGRLDDARRNYERALDIYKRVGDAHSLDMANARRGYAILLDELDDPDGAVREWRAARNVYSACGIEDGVRECDQHLGAGTGGSEPG